MNQEGPWRLDVTAYNKQEVRRTPHGELVKIFRELPPPSLEEMDGEFLATGLDQSNRLRNHLGSLFVNWPGLWLGKAFHPESSTGGKGYNFFLRNKEILRAFPMGTYLAPSGVTSGPSYHVDYSRFHTGFITGSGRDEIRKVSDGLYLGVGRLTYSRAAGCRLYPFLLEGPTAPFSLSDAP
jgi:hypothetical protein